MSDAVDKWATNQFQFEVSTNEILRCNCQQIKTQKLPHLDDTEGRKPLNKQKSCVLCVLGHILKNVDLRIATQPKNSCRTQARLAIAAIISAETTMVYSRSVSSPPKLRVAHSICCKTLISVNC